MKPDTELKKYVRVNFVEAKPMTRGDYKAFRELELSSDEDPAEEGYIIFYRSGLPSQYVSWCPKKHFDEVSHLADSMTFGEAIEAMKQGHKVSRRGWNGKDMWLSVPLSSGAIEVPCHNVWGKHNAEYAQQNGGCIKVNPYITMKAADGSIVLGWLASQTDMLSTDWYIVP